MPYFHKDILFIIQVESSKILPIISYLHTLFEEVVIIAVKNVMSATLRQPIYLENYSKQHNPDNR